MALNLTHYLQTPNDYRWVDREDARLTEQGRRNMMETMYRTLRALPAGKFLDIAKVQAENRELFIKTACEFMEFYPDYRFNRNCTLIHHDFPILFPLKKTATDEERKERKDLERERRRLLA